MRAPGLDLLLHTLVDLQLLMNEEQEFISLYFQMQVTALFVAQQKRKSGGGGCVAGIVSAAITRTAFIFHGLRRRWQLYLWLGGATSQWVYSSPAAAAATTLSKHAAEKKTFAC